MMGRLTFVEGFWEIGLSSGVLVHECFFLRGRGGDDESISSAGAYRCTVAGIRGFDIGF